MKQVQKVLVLVIDRELTAVEFVQCSALRFQQKAHHKTQHENMQFFVLVNRSHVSFIQIKHFFGDLRYYRRRRSNFLLGHVLSLKQIVQDFLQGLCLASKMGWRLYPQCHFYCGQLRFLKARNSIGALVHTVFVGLFILEQLVLLCHLGSGVLGLVSCLPVGVCLVECVVTSERFVLRLLNCFHLFQIWSLALLYLRLNIKFFLSLAVFLNQSGQTQTAELKFEPEF